MLTFLALAGRLASPLLAFVPGFNPKAMMWFAGFFALLVVIGGPAGAVWIHMRGEVKTAEIARDLHWTTELQKAKAAHENRIAEALDAARTTPALPDTAAGLDELCRKSKTCRDNHRRGK